MTGVILSVLGIPVVFWFIMESLRKANLNIIPQTDDLQITIANLVKVYGRKSKMSRDYGVAKKLSRIAENRLMGAKAKQDNLIWQVPLFGFLIWFTWYYLVSGAWQIISSIVVYYFVIQIAGNYYSSYP